jgi:hypothetical protein
MVGKVTTKRRPPTRMTAQEIKALALQMYKGEVFTSLQVRESDMHNLALIFMPLAFMGAKARKALAKKSIGMFYGKIAAASRSVNGYPILPSFATVSRDDTKKVLAKLQEIKSAMEKL